MPKSYIYILNLNLDYVLSLQFTRKKLTPALPALSQHDASRPPAGPGQSNPAGMHGGMEARQGFIRVVSEEALYLILIGFLQVL